MVRSPAEVIRLHLGILQRLKLPLLQIALMIRPFDDVQVYTSLFAVQGLWYVITRWSGYPVLSPACSSSF